MDRSEVQDPRQTPMMLNDMVWKNFALGIIANERIDVIATRYPIVENVSAKPVDWYKAMAMVGGNAPLNIVINIPTLNPDLPHIRLGSDGFLGVSSFRVLSSSDAFSCEPPWLGLFDSCFSSDCGPAMSDGTDERIRGLSFAAVELVYRI